MTKDEFEKVKVGDVVVITFQGPNYGKLGTVREIHAHHSGVVCLEPLNCQLNIPEGYKIEQNKDGFYYFRKSGISFAVEDSKKEFYVTLLNGEKVLWSTIDFNQKELAVIARFLKELDRRTDFEHIESVDIIDVD